MDKGILSKLQIVNLILDYPLKLIEKVKKFKYDEQIKKWKKAEYPEEVDIIQSYSGRNKALDFIMDHTPKKSNTLLLVKEIDHLNLFTPMRMTDV